jgi:hypothetical protein
MGIPFYKLLLLSFVGIACTSSSNKQETHKEKDNIIGVNAYDDIDLFNLKGLGRKEGLMAYPFIQIDSIDKFQKRIVYKISKKDSVERIYKKEKNYWTTFYEYRIDTGYTQTYEYIEPDKIIELDYEGTYKKTGYHLHDASIIAKGKMITYGFWGDKGIDIKPDPNNVEILKKRGKAIFTDSFFNRNDRLIIMSSTFDKIGNNTSYSDTTCYKVYGHSWFWWRYFAREPSKCD